MSALMCALWRWLGLGPPAPHRVIHADHPVDLDALDARLHRSREALRELTAEIWPDFVRGQQRKTPDDAAGK